MKTRLTDLQKMITQKIPLTRSMGLKVVRLNQLQFKLPLKPNINHVGTFFGGSLVSAQAVAAWILILQFLSQRDGQADKPSMNLSDLEKKFKIVLKSSKSSFYKPALKNALIVPVAPSSKKVHLFFNQLDSQNKATLKIKVQIFDSNKASKIPLAESVFNFYIGLY